MGKLWHWVYEIWRTIKHFKTYLAIKCRHVVIIKCFHVLCWYRFDMNSKKILFLTQAAFVAGFKTHWIKSRYRDKHASCLCTPEVSHDFVFIFHAFAQFLFDWYMYWENKNTSVARISTHCSLAQGPLKKWTEHSQELHLLKLHKGEGGSYYTPGLDGGWFFRPRVFIIPKS